MTHASDARGKRAILAAASRFLGPWIARPWPKKVLWGSFGRLRPISEAFGRDRGQQGIGRYYVEEFLARHASDVKGRVLEVGDARYTGQFGAAVTDSDVLHAVPGNPVATIVGDLADPNCLSEARYDCIILTAVLQCVRDPFAAVRNCRAALKPGGVLLATLPAIAQGSRNDRESWGDYWRWTGQGAALLFSAFDPHVTVTACGNVLVACARLHGLATDEVSMAELRYLDPDYPIVITARAVKAQ